jgi:arginyl-tRNA--protein-N-Asp/Glu arginylyltransferase
VTGGAPREASRARLARLVGALGLEPSAPSPCPYLPGRDSRLVALRPNRLTPRLYGLFLDQNFRRLQDLVYRPQCDGCRECRQLRVDTRRFRPTRAQRRCSRRNADVVAEVGRPLLSAEKHAVYARYLEARHDGAMSGSWEEFGDFLHAAPEMSHEVVFRAGGRLVGAGIFDVARDALSAVYFYFDPELAARSPGTFNVLWLVEEAKRRSCAWLYLGYYVAGSPRMAYKAGFYPHEILDDDGRFRPGAPVEWR